MTDVEQLTSEAQNPTVVQSTSARTEGRIPLSVPQRRLEVPNIPGYYLRWLKGTSQRLAQAERAGFVFVTSDEIQLNNVSMGGDATKDGNTDLGSRVSVAEGGEIDGSGNAVRMYLMKQKYEWYLEDKAAGQKRNDSVAAALTSQYREGTVGGSAPGETSSDMSHRYVDKTRAKVPELFWKKPEK